MKKYTITQVAQQVGLSKVISETYETGQPIYLESKGKVVAVVMPCTDAVVEIQNNILNFSKVLGMLSKDEDDSKVFEHLVSNLINGVLAESILYESGQKSVVEHIRKGLVSNIVRAIQAEEMNRLHGPLEPLEDSAMLESNMSANGAEADQQGGRKARPAKSVIKKKKSSAKSVKLPPTGGKSSKGDSFEYRMKA